jgi:serine/threonine protein phosphatase PrpC
MRFESRSFWIAKDLEDPQYYEDAFELDADRGMAAIADGVSSAIFSGLWARLLTQAATQQPPDQADPAGLQTWLAPLREAWWAGIDTGNLAWHQRAKMVDGAMSTLLWVALAPTAGENGTPAGYSLRAKAVGDCCLFHLRDGRSLRSFPVTNSAEFDLLPAALGSIDRRQDHLLEFQTLEDVCLPGDMLVLCTDALGLWAMERCEAGEPVDWGRYWDMAADQWQEEVVALRQDRQLRYDDTTLVLLRIVDETTAPATAAPDEAEPASDAPAAVEDELIELVEVEVVEEPPPGDESAVTD